MTDRDKLKELLKQAQDKYCDICAECAEDGYKDHESFEDFFADYLLANGVIVPPCKVGDKVWNLHQQYNGTFTIREGKISMITQKADKSWHLRITVNSSVWGFTPNEIGTRYFLTKEEAEAELRKRGVSNAENN